MFDIAIGISSYGGGEQTAQRQRSQIVARFFQRLEYPYPGLPRDEFGGGRRSLAVGTYAVGKYAVGKYAVGKYAVGKYAVGKYAVGKYAVGKYIVIDRGNGTDVSILRVIDGRHDLGSLFP